MVNEGSNNTGGGHSAAGDSGIFNSLSDGLKPPISAHQRIKSTIHTARSSVQGNKNSLAYQAMISLIDDNRLDQNDSMQIL